MKTLHDEAMKAALLAIGDAADVMTDDELELEALALAVRYERILNPASEISYWLRAISSATRTIVAIDHIDDSTGKVLGLDEDGELVEAYVTKDPVQRERVLSMLLCDVMRDDDCKVALYIGSPDFTDIYQTMEHDYQAESIIWCETLEGK